MTKVYFECRDVKSSWVESTDVKSLDTAEEEIKEIINQFNNTLRPHEKPREFIKLVAQKSSPLEEMGHIIVGRKVVGGYRALKYSNGGIFAWVDAEKIKSKKGLLNLKTEDDLHNLKFRCPGNINTMNLETEYPYVDTKCKGCPMLTRYADTGSYTCRLRKYTDRNRIYAQ